jgi:hypothetical protein
MLLHQRAELHRDVVVADEQRGSRRGLLGILTQSKLHLFGRRDQFRLTLH